MLFSLSAYIANASINEIALCYGKHRTILGVAIRGIYSYAIHIVFHKGLIRFESFRKSPFEQAYLLSFIIFVYFFSDPLAAGDAVVHVEIFPFAESTAGKNVMLAQKTMDFFYIFSVV